MGAPQNLNAICNGSLDWHPNASRFVGSGLSKNNVLFSYIADWTGPGRWGIDLLTEKRRLILKPLEKLSTISLGSINSEEHILNDTLDQNYKPGLYLQVEAFLSGTYENLCRIDQHQEYVSSYYKIAGYKC